MIQRVLAESTIVTAVVCAADGVRFSVTGRVAEDVVPALVDYLLPRCDHVLWPSAAAEVRASLAAHRPYAAIATYFEHVGARWDEERLEVARHAVISLERSSFSPGRRSARARVGARRRLPRSA